MPEAPGPAGEGCSFALRSATTADAAVLAGLIEDLNRSEGDPTGYVSTETVARDLAAGRISVVVAEAEGAVIGYCLYHVGYEATYAANGLYIVDLFVVEGRRRAGIGRALIAEVARRSRDAGGVFVWWTAKPGNAAANAVYLRLGAFSEPVIAHAVFDESFDRLVAAAEVRASGGPASD
jgi:GNAT superfamily N-acetyltransferase